MISNTWAFIKRHKGKIIAGSMLVSGAVAYAYHTQEQAHRSALLSVDENTLKFKARRHYVFDTNHRACDQSITSIVPDLQALVQRRFNIELLIVRLKECPDMSVEDKVELWQKIKVLSVARIVGIAYSYSLLTLAMKAQISILAHDICSEFEYAVCYTPSWYGPGLFSRITSNYRTLSAYRLDTIKSQVEGYLGYKKEPIWDPFIKAKSEQGAANRQIFIRCIEYYANTGVSKLLDVIESTCSEYCSTLALTDRVNQDNLREVLDAVDKKLSESGPSFFSKLVAPLSEDEKLSTEGVLPLLSRLVKALESEKGRETLTSLVDFYHTAAVHKVPKEPEVLVKLLPSMPDVFHFISTDGYDSPLKNSLCSSDVYRFAKFAAAYGACVSRQAERISKDACADEFSKLLDCVKKQQKKA
ncbi:Peroxin-3 [Cooperia oncophora]